MTAQSEDSARRLAEERLARLSVLRELSVAALELSAPAQPVDAFLERVAERLGALAVLWLGRSIDGADLLLGAAGLSRTSRALPFGPGQTLPYPELARQSLVRWEFPLLPGASGELAADSSLLLFFDGAQVPEAYRSMVERLARDLSLTLTHRHLYEQLQRNFEELRRTQERLVARERLAAIGEMAAVVAHEVRNPLGAIFNAISSLRKRVSGLETAPLLDILEEEAEQVNGIVGDLLDFASPRDISPRTESLERILEGALEGARNASGEMATSRLSLEIPRPLPPVYVDARLMRQALLNLLMNGLQATTDTGRVTMRATRAPCAGKEGVRVEVADDGAGIRQELQKRIFEPFFTTKARGTGLGLSVVRRIVEAHHGEVSVSSAPGAGATFTVLLPAPA